MHRSLPNYCLMACLCCWWVPRAQGQDPTRFADEIADYHRRDTVSPPADGVVLFVGSSSIRMWHDVADYFPGVPVINRGFGGSQMSDLLHNADALIFRYKPSQIFIYEGDNDIAHGKSSRQVMCDTKKLMKQIRRRLPGVPVVFLSAKPSPARWDKKAEFEKLNRRLARYACWRRKVSFADTWSALMDATGQPNPEFYLEDQLHLTAKAYQAWQQVLASFIIKAKP